MNVNGTNFFHFEEIENSLFANNAVYYYTRTHYLLYTTQKLLLEQDYIITGRKGDLYVFNCLTKCSEAN